MGIRSKPLLTKELFWRQKTVTSSWKIVSRRSPRLTAAHQPLRAACGTVGGVSENRKVESTGPPLYSLDMLNTIKAVVHGDRIDWQEPVEQLVAPNQSLEVLVTLLEPRPNSLSLEEQGRRRVAALQRLAAQHAFAAIPDPAQWEREARQDRELPGRP